MEKFLLRCSLIAIHLILIFATVGFAQVPTEQDCLGAIPVCQDIYVQEDTYLGVGNYANEVYNNPGDCTQDCPGSCLDGEQNSVWYVFTVQQSGQLRLIIDPFYDDDDYDWAVYDISLFRCDQIYSNYTQMQKSCNAWGSSTFNGNTGISTQQGGTGNCNHCGDDPSTNKWNADLSVTAGSTYVLIIENWGTNPDGGYTLDFSSSTAVIYDNVRPNLSDVLEEEISCGVDYIIVDFSENVQCSSVQASDFLVDGPGGPYNVVDVHGEACDLGGDYESRYTLTLDRPINSDGDYSVQLIPMNFVYDACNNFALGNTIVFNVSLGAPQLITNQMVITPATCGIPNGSITGLSVVGSNPPFSYEWTDNNGTTVGTSIDLVDVLGGDYFLTITDENTCVTVEGPYTIPEVGGPVIIESSMLIDAALWGVPNGSITGLQIEGTGPFTYTWTDEDANIVGTELDLLNVYTGYYNLLVVDVNQCDTLGGPYFVPQEGGPLSAEATADPDQICFGFSTILHAVGNGGSGVYTYTWSSDPEGFNSTMQDPVVEPEVTTTYFVEIDDGYNVMTASVTVTVFSLPIAIAGNDTIIPHGWSITLNGNVSNGTGPYIWFWSPDSLFINPTSQNASTVSLIEPQLFWLTVRDLSTGCMSEESYVSVSINGGPLQVSAASTDPNICSGDSTRLYALPGGGNFPNYQYTWYRVVGSTNIFMSNDSVITIYPPASQTYKIEVFDGQITASDTININIMPSPQFAINDIPDDSLIMACPYDTVKLYPSITKPGWTYLWSNGATTPEINVGTTGIGFDSKKYNLKIFSEEGCEGEDSVTVVFDFSHCFGVDEYDDLSTLNIYPNPTTGLITIEIEDIEDYREIIIFDSQGRQIAVEPLKEAGKGSWKKTIDLSKYSRGVFMIKAVNERYIQMRKIVVR